MSGREALLPIFRLRVCRPDGISGGSGGPSLIRRVGTAGLSCRCARPRVTAITHIKHGVNFLGHTLRKRKGPPAQGGEFDP
jgi:hypothetical protein